MRDLAKAQELLSNLERTMQELVRVMPGMSCDLVRKEIKNINNSISILNTEAENHGEF